MKSVLSRLALLISLAMTFTSLVGCSNMSDNSLLTNEASNTSGNDVSKTPLSTEVFIALDNPTVQAANVSASVEVTGSCYISTYPDNYIQVFDGSGNSVAVTDLKTGSGTPKCRDGRFALIIASGALAVGTTNLKIQLPVIDSSNATTLNQANAVRYFSITKPGT